MEGLDLSQFGADPEELEQFRARYDVAELLGRGAAARVHAGRDRESGNAIALKFCVVREPELCERFLREGRMMQDLAHSCVLTVHSTGRVGDLPYMCTELLRGGSLRQHLEAGGVVAPALAARLAMDVLAGVQECHAAGIVHRDLKPGNVLLTGDGRAKIADLGVAKAWGAAEPLTGEGMLLGTPAYMAPEQLRGDPAAVASDLYAIGIIMFEMLTGRLPHAGISLIDIARGGGPGAAAAVRGLAGHLPEGLLSLIERLLAPRPSDRPASAEDAANMLRRVSRMAGWISSGTTRSVRALDPVRVDSRKPRVESPRSQPGAGRRSPAALAMAAASGGRPTGRRPALPSMRSFRARSGQLLVPGVRASVGRALARLDVRTLAALAALLALSALMVRWMVGA